MIQRHDTGADFRHFALFYANEAEYVAGITEFLREGVAAGEPELVVVSAEKIQKLRGALGADAEAVLFADMADVGANPARIIPAWQEFVDRHAGNGRPLRGVGEPIYPERSPDELVECQRHEALLNVAFDGGPTWQLLCPYDTARLEAGVIDVACHTHPILVDDEEQRSSDEYMGTDVAAQPFEAPLPAPPHDAAEMDFDMRTLGWVRTLVSREAEAAGLSAQRAEGLVMAANEVATNSVRHGGGRGVVRVWRGPLAVICEVRDRGRLTDALAGRRRPVADRDGGRGLWLANQLCYLVQLRNEPAGSVVRLHARLR